MKAVIEYEKRNSYINSKRDTLNYIINTSTTVEDMMWRIRSVIVGDFKFGCGGHHIWCSNPSNERLFIIYLD